MLAADRGRLIADEYAYVAGVRRILDRSPTILWNGRPVRDFRQIDALQGLQASTGAGYVDQAGIDLLQGAVGMANPAAVYCMELGYEYRIEKRDSGEYGVCVLPDGECRAWDFLTGRCGREHSFCALNGFDLEVRNDGKDSLSRNYAVCVDDGEVIGSVSELMALSERCTDPRLVSASVPDLPAPALDAGGSVVRTETAFDWRDHNGHDWLTSVKDQGGCGSCWAFAAVGCAEPQYNIDLNDPDFDVDLSEQYLVTDCFSMYGYETCCGGHKHLALEFMESDGIPDEDCLPYLDGYACSCGGGGCNDNCNYSDDDLGYCSDYMCTDRCPDWASRLFLLAGTGRATANYQQHLMGRGPLAISIGYGSAYGGSYDENGVYRCEQDYGTNHSVVIVGFNDAEGYWIAKNSWGTDWQDEGYFKLGYGECAAETLVFYAEATHAQTVSAGLSCSPGSGTLPFDSTISVSMTNLCSEEIRRVAGRLDVTLANGQHFPNWRAGFTNLDPNESYSTSWAQTIPALGSVAGDNVFTMTGEDVTPAPYNQPPYLSSGDTDTDSCVVRGIDPQQVVEVVLGQGSVEDTFIRQGVPDNYSSSTTHLCTYTYPTDNIANAILMQWDLSSIPESATVLQATLELYLFEADGVATYDLPVHRIINVLPVISACNWDTYDGTNQWSGGPIGAQQDIAPAEDTVPVGLDTDLFISWDVTGMVAGWLVDPESNLGLLINSDGTAPSNSYRYFTPSENAVVEHRPRLLIRYVSGG